MQMWTRKQYFLSPNWVLVQLALPKTHFLFSLIMPGISHTDWQDPAPYIDSDYPE